MQKFDATAPIVTVLDIPAGRIQLVAGERSDAVVEVRPADASKSRDVKTAEQVEVTFADGVLRIVTAPPKHAVLGHSGAVEVMVQLPAGSQVQAKAAAAELRGVGRLGEVAFEAAQGRIELDEAASARLTLQSGDALVGSLSGPAEITTQSGDIRVAEATSGTVVLRTQAGAITVGAAAGVSASLDAATHSGRVTNALRNTGTSDLRIQATTAQGDITARSL